MIENNVLFLFSLHEVSLSGSQSSHMPLKILQLCGPDVITDDLLYVDVFDEQVLEVQEGLESERKVGERLQFLDIGSEWIIREVEDGEVQGSDVEIFDDEGLVL